MKKGNNLAGIQLNKGYNAIWLFPIGLEIFTEKHLEVFEISIIIHPISFNFNIKKSLTLFRND